MARSLQESNTAAEFATHATEILRQSTLTRQERHLKEKGDLESHPPWPALHPPFKSFSRHQGPDSAH